MTGHDAGTPARPPRVTLPIAYAAARAGELVTTKADLPAAVGARTTMTSAEGQPFGELRLVTIGRRTLGVTTPFREAVVVGEMRVRDSWVAFSDRECAAHSSFGAERPAWKVPLPLEAGLVYEYESESGPVRARVEGPEEIEVPAGKFSCLVCVQEREADRERRTQRHWSPPAPAA